MKILYRTKVWKFSNSLLRPLHPHEYQLNALEDRFILKSDPELEVLYENVNEVISEGIYIHIKLKDNSEITFEIPQPFPLTPAMHDAEVRQDATKLAKRLNSLITKKPAS